MGHAKVHPHTNAHLPHHSVTWVSLAVSNLPLAHSMRGGGVSPVSCPFVGSCLTPAMVISRFSIIELLVTCHPVWRVALVVRSVFLRVLSATPMPGLLLCLQFHLKEGKVLFSVLPWWLSAVPCFLRESMLQVQVRTVKSPLLLPASCPPLVQLPAIAVIMGTVLGLSFQVKAEMSPGPSLAGCLLLLLMAISGLSQLRRPSTALWAGVPVCGGTAGQRRGGSSALSLLVPAPAMTVCSGSFRNLLSGVTPGLLWAMGGQTRRGLVVQGLMEVWGQTHSRERKELDTRCWKCRQSMMKERAITGTDKAGRVQERTQWNGSLASRAAQEATRLEHRSNPKVSERFLDKDKSIQRQMTFNDATGAEKLPREQLISWWHITAAGSWNHLGKICKEGHKMQEKLGDSEGHKARRGQAEWSGWTLVYKHRWDCLGFRHKVFHKKNLTGEEDPHKAEKK